MVARGWDGGHDDVVWLGLGVLRLHRFGEPWSVWRWLDNDRHWSDDFYVNLEDPWRRTSIGFDSGDWVLDVVARGDGSWRYKDDDELEWARVTGEAGADWVERVRGAAALAVERIEGRAWPFSADWDRWLPPERPTLPRLPDEWSRIDAPGSGF